MSVLGLKTANKKMPTNKALLLGTFGAKQGKKKASFVPGLANCQIGNMIGSS